MAEVALDTLRVVVGVDFSEACDDAIHEAMLLGDLVPRSELHFAHVIEASPELHDARRIAELSDALCQAMARLERYVRDTIYVDRAELAESIVLGYHVRVGPIARELHQVAVDVDSELIVVGKSQPGMLRRLWHRSTVNVLLRIAHVPVVIAQAKDFRGLAKSPRPDAPRLGEDLEHSGSYATIDLYESSRETHISGML